MVDTTSVLVYTVHQDASLFTTHEGRTMQYAIIPKDYRGLMSDTRELSVYNDVAWAMTAGAEYSAPIMQFEPYSIKTTYTRWGRIYVRRFGTDQKCIWAITVKRWKQNDPHEFDGEIEDTFNPRYDWPEAGFMLMIGRMIGKLT